MDNHVPHPHRTVRISGYAIRTQEYPVMRFGHRNAPATLQRWINEHLTEFLNITILAYIDEILMNSDKVHSLVIHVRQVLKKRRNSGVNLKVSKCHFHTAQVEYLGFVVSPSGVFMDLKKIQGGTDWPLLTNIKDIQCFLSFANYYRHVKQSYSNVCKLLFALQMNEHKFVFNDEAQSAFHHLKTGFTSAPIIGHFDPVLPITV